jgi:hypothetical protein
MIISRLHTASEVGADQYLAGGRLGRTGWAGGQLLRYWDTGTHRIT